MGDHSLYKGKVWHVAITTITDLGPNELLFIKKKNLDWAFSSYQVKIQSFLQV